MSNTTWNDGIAEEINFWDYWFNDKGIHWPDDYKFRLNPDTELQQDIKDLLSGIDDPRVLDVGAGPLTFLGKKINGKSFEIVPLDALAVHYDSMLENHNIIPIVRTQRWNSEDLADLPENFGKFDMVIAQNTLDHSYAPMKAIMAMPKVLKPGGIIYLKHYINEGERGKYQGLHQWNFYQEGECVMLRSRDEMFNVTEMFSQMYPGCDHNCHVTDTNELVYIIKFPEK